MSMDRRSHAFYTRNYGNIDAAMNETNVFEPGHNESNQEGNPQPTTNANAEVPHPSSANHTFSTGIDVGIEHYPHEIGDFEVRDLDDDQLSHMSSHYHDDVHNAEMIARELGTTWILNLSMRYKDRSNREKFFVTYREHEQHWRRVTVTLDYRNAPEDSLEEELRDVRSQREKSSKIYESIRQSLREIQFYDTVTNLKLETTDGRLHVHVVEDANVRRQASSDSRLMLNLLGNHPISSCEPTSAPRMPTHQGGGHRFQPPHVWLRIYSDR